MKVEYYIKVATLTNAGSIKTSLKKVSKNKAGRLLKRYGEYASVTVGFAENFSKLTGRSKGIVLFHTIAKGPGLAFPKEEI